MSLAYHLAHSPLQERTILIIDKDRKQRNDRTWCFWTDRPTLFDGILYRTWDKVEFVGETFRRQYDLAPYHYQMVRGIDFYRATQSDLQARPNVEFLQGRVEHIQDGAGQAQVTVNGQTFCAGWVFDSRFAPGEFRPDPARYHNLKQHFKGWEIETAAPAFDPQSATLFDFRTPQNGRMRFVYVLPFSDRRALVEYTLFSADLLTRAEYEQGLKDYLAGVLRLTDYRILDEESGVIPMTDFPFPRRAGQRVMKIGTPGGLVKPSTGYAFLRIQRDSEAIVQSLVQTSQPFAVPHSPPRYGLFDSIILQLMYRRAGLMKSIFTALFQRNPIQRIFRFLDEANPWDEDLHLLASLPPLPFVQALYKLKVARKV